MFERSDFDSRGRHKDKHVMLCWSEVLANRGLYVQCTYQSLIESGCLVSKGRQRKYSQSERNLSLWRAKTT